MKGRVSLLVACSVLLASCGGVRTQVASLPAPALPAPSPARGLPPDCPECGRIDRIEVLQGLRATPRGGAVLGGVVGGVLARKALIVDGPTGEVRAVAFTRDATCVVTAGVDGLVQLWDADKGKLLGTRGTRSGSINALATDGATLWVGGADERVRTWDIHTETRDVSALGAIMEKVPWEIDGIDVVRRVDLGTWEGSDGKRR